MHGGQLLHLDNFSKHIQQVCRLRRQVDLRLIDCL